MKKVLLSCLCLLLAFLMVCNVMRIGFSNAVYVPPHYETIYIGENEYQHFVSGHYEYDALYLNNVFEKIQSIDIDIFAPLDSAFNNIEYAIDYISIVSKQIADLFSSPYNFQVANGNVVDYVIGLVTLVVEFLGRIGSIVWKIAHMLTVAVVMIFFCFIALVDIFAVLLFAIIDFVTILFYFVGLDINLSKYFSAYHDFTGTTTNMLKDLLDTLAGVQLQ